MEDCLGYFWKKVTNIISAHILLVSEYFKSLFLLPIHDCSQCIQVYFPNYPTCVVFVAESCLVSLLLLSIQFFFLTEVCILVVFSLMAHVWENIDLTLIQEK